MINNISQAQTLPPTLCNGGYERVKELWNSLLPEQKKDALDTAHIYYKGISLDVSYHTMKVALKAIGML